MTDPPLRALSVPEAIEQARAHTPWEHPRAALFRLVGEQLPRRRITAEDVRDAFEGIIAGAPLPPIGLTHLGVQVALGFSEADWQIVLAPLLTVARGEAPVRFGYAIEAAQRILATRELLSLPEDSLRGFLIGVIDPTAPPMSPRMFAFIRTEFGVTAAAAEAAIANRPFATRFVRPILDAERVVG